MSEILSQRVKLAIALGGAIIVGKYVSTAVWQLVKRKLDDKPPKKWRKVGELSELFCFPIKSCGWIQIDELNCNQVGVNNNDFMRDRTFMVVTSEGEFVTARKYPKLVQVMPEIEENIMTLSAPGMKKVELYFQEMLNKDQTEAVVWGESVKVYDAGDDLARWFSRFVLEKDSGLRLVFYDFDFPTRDVRWKNIIANTATRADTGALHDATSFMLINESSISELNTRIESPVTALQFRPNFVVSGAKAFDEDKWKWIKIGNEAVFRNVRPCTRCTFTNIDPHSGERHPREEPLKTLKSYRMFKEAGASPVMGVHLGVRRQGKIRLGDAVYVEDD